MSTRLATPLLLILSSTLPCSAQTPPEPPVELDVLKASVGVWDTEVEVWPQGPDAPPMTFEGVETNRAYGEYWIASDLDSFIDGETMSVHSIVGYDLDQGKLVGKVVDHGPYAATLSGEYDAASKTVTWTTDGKTPTGAMIVQKTTVTQVSDDERVLVLSVPSGEADEFTKFMRIRYKRRQ